MYTYIQKKIHKNVPDFDIPNLMLNHTVLQVNKKNFRIIEIEFYVNSEEHKDEYTHGSDEQHTYGFWYFHKYKNGTYKSGTYKGLDLTLGNKDTSYGILIRSIQDLSTNEITEGCCNCVNKILSEYKINTISEFTNDTTLLCTKNDRDFVINDFNIDEYKVYDGKRVGLSDKYPEFRDKPYRFAIMINKLKKHVKYFNK
jgi:3-methyladenine DNA glycosylase Mpg